MTREQYLNQRKALVDEAQKLIDEGSAKEAEAKMKEIKELDDKWDSIAQAQANFDAMNKEPVAVRGITVEDAFGKDKGGKEAAAAFESEDYKNAWAKTLMGRPLSDEESTIYKMVNEEFTHTTGNTNVVIPKSVAAGIWEIAGELYPYFADVNKSYVNGVFSMIMDDTSSDAAWYTEDDENEDGKETFKDFNLGGCELSRSITVSWKLKEMAMEDFIPYIQRKMAKKMGAGAGYGATHGAGAKAADGKPEPMGTVTALLTEKDTPQVVIYTGKPSYTDITKARALIKSGYGAGLSIYANSSTIWSQLANVVDANKRPLFIPDPTNQGVFRILGMVVKEDDSMKDGEILFSNAKDGYHMNINKEISMMTEEHVKKRRTDYCGYAIMDGNILTSKAHALLTTQEAAGTGTPEPNADNPESATGTNP